MSEPLIFKKMIEVMNEASHIDKVRKNQAQGYSFRGIDDVYNMLHGVMAKCGVFCIPRVVNERSEMKENKSGNILIYRIISMEFDFYAEDGSKVTASTIGEGMDSGDKATNKAMSVAQKYALLQTFLIPTEEDKDPEVDHHEIRVSESVSALIKLLKEQNIGFDNFSQWLRETKRIDQKQDLRCLSDDRAKKAIESFGDALISFKKWESGSNA